MTYYVYLLASKRNGTLYTGVTNNLQRRLYEHRAKLVPGFTSRYNVALLVHFEETEDITAAIEREKQIKSWSRRKKPALIEAENPHWEDLAEGWGN